MEFDDHILQGFLEPQIRDHGGNVEIDQGLWTLFAVPAHDALANAIARSVLRDAKFAHDSGSSADDQWMLYYVDTANRPEAIHWLHDLTKLLAGEIRPVSPTQRALIDEVVSSDRPHRAAQQLADLHTRGEISAGTVREPVPVRSLLDRLHSREPLFYSAMQILLAHHLVDMVVLLQQLISEDLALNNEIVKGGLSRDPFLQSRQDTAAEIRQTLLSFQVINPIDQQKNTAISNPYAVYLDVVSNSENITAPIDGTAVTVPRENFLNAIHVVRRNLSRGEEFNSFDTQSPWMNKEIAHPFRFIKQRVADHRELAIMDVLYMLERAVAS